jgi:hypothetical protein
MSCLVLVVAVGLVGQPTEVTDRDKKAYLEMLKELPRKGEFFTEDAVVKAAPYTRVLLALSEKDIKGYDLYPFLALSRGLIEREDQRQLGIKQFRKIAHPQIKLAWAALLFNARVDSAEIVKYLQAALKSTEQRKVLSQLLGPDFDDFRRRVKACHPPSP